MEKIKFSLLYKLLIILLMKSNCCFGAKILAITPVAAMGHFNYNNAVLKTLANAGHEVTIITSFPQLAASENYSRIIDVSLPRSLVHVSTIPYNMFRQKTDIEIIKCATFHMKELCDNVLEAKEYQDLLNSKDIFYDVIIVEITYMYKCFLPLAEKLNVPVIGLTPEKWWYLADRILKNVDHPADVTYGHIASWKSNSIYERIINIWHFFVVEYGKYFYGDPVLKKFYQEHEEQLRPYSEFVNIEPAIIFYNSDRTIFPRSLNPNAIEIGGINVSPAKALPEKVKKFIDEANHGVILFSLGSFVKASTLPNSTVELFVNVFSSIPQRVIWKFEEEIENVPTNVMLLKWLPQRDILEHPNVIAFISHCGQSSLYEAIYTATPVIACPIVFDQPTNAGVLESLGVAVQLNIDSLSEEVISNAINSIVSDTRYSENMQKLSKDLKSRPVTPQQSVVYWTEYVIRHKGAHNLKTTSSQLNWFRYLLLDVVCVVAISISFIVYFAYWCLKAVTSLCKFKIKLHTSHKNKLN